jgi:methyl-accepting chemotaxis protein
MALVKRSELLNKTLARAPAVPEPEPKRLPEKASVARSRELNRSRARQEKAAERIGAATEQLAAGIAEAASAADQLARSLTQIATAAEEAAGSSQESQVAIQNLSRIFGQSRDRAEISRQKTDSLRTLLATVGGEVEALSTSIGNGAARQFRSVGLVEDLERQATNIGEIATGVGDISDQTNLLALNAAIEAARAGEHGRGFAVVADEVRALAATSEMSTREVQSLVESVVGNVRTIASRIRAAAEVAEAEARNGRAVVASFTTARAGMRAIAEGAEAILLAAVEAERGVAEAQKGAEQIAGAAEEQAAATEQAQRAVQQQSASLEQSRRTAESLAQLAESLQSGGDLINAEQVASAAEELSATVQELSGAATQIHAAVDQIGKGTQAQASATQESTAAMSQIEKATSLARSAASKSIDSATELSLLLNDNRAAAVKLSSSAVDNLAETRAMDELVGALETNGRHIEKIVDGIALVAVQINMLAVSGSIEAARAGEFGRGFAVVSGDIRKLARDSSENAETAKDVVRAIRSQIMVVQRDLQQVAAIIDAEMFRHKTIAEGLTAVDADMTEVKAGLSEIVAGSDSIVSSVREVLAGTQQIARAAEEASGAAREAATAAREQARGAEDLAAAIEEIASLADELHIAKT